MAATPIKIEVQNSGPSLKNTIYILRYKWEYYKNSAVYI